MKPANLSESRTPEGGFLERNNNWYIRAHSITAKMTCKYDSLDQFMERYFENYVSGAFVRFAPGSQYIVEKSQALNYSKKLWKSLMEELPKNNMPEAHIIERALWIIITCKFIEKSNNGI